MRLQLARATDLAVRALVELQHGDGRTRGSQLAARIGTTAGLLPQIMRPLIDQRWVDSIRGPQGGYSLLVPTLDLLTQWRRQLHDHVPATRIGQLGGGQADDLHDHHVVMATPHSAAAVPIDLPQGAIGLLVADEAHRYGAPTWGEALKPTSAGWWPNTALPTQPPTGSSPHSTSSSSGCTDRT